MLNKNSIFGLLDKIKDGDEDALRELFRIYAPLIEAKVSEYSSLVEEDDIRQIASIGLFEAAQSYSPKKSEDITFGLYAKICIRNRVITETRRIHPAHEPMDDNTPDGIPSPEEEIIRREEMQNAFSCAKRKLTPYEDSVLRLYLGGNSYGAIAQKLNKTVKSVDNAMSRIRNKFRSSL